MKMIIGLGNPGIKYEKTRHNLGALVVEQFLKDYEPVGQTRWEDNKKLKSDIAEIYWKKEKVILAKPKTYMNNSGLAVHLISQYLNIPVSDIWIVHDDVDLPLGAMKIRFGGAAAGHKGVGSIIEVLGTDKFWRFRLGIGNPSKKEIDDYVLGKFAGGEWGKARELIKRGSKAIAMALEEGLEVAMNRFNTK